MVAKGAALLLTLTRSVASVVTATREEGSFARLETTSVIVVVLATFQRCVEPRVNHQRRRKQLGRRMGVTAGAQSDPQHLTYQNPCPLNLPKRMLRTWRPG